MNKIITTNFSQAWINFRKTEDYKRCSEALKKAGIKQPFRNNILWTAFTAGWNATGTVIKKIEP